MISIFFFCYGLVWGSFICMLVYRSIKGVSFFTTRSYCEGCLKNIPPLYLMPILGYFFTRGRCQKCLYKIPRIYPLIELACGIGFVLGFLKFHLVLSLAKFYLFFCVSIILMVMDIKFKTLPLSYNLFLYTLGILFTQLLPFPEHNLKGLLIGFFPLFLLWGLGTLTFKKDIVGLGDVLLIGSIGLLWGNIILLKIIPLSFILGGCFVGVGLGLKKLKRHDTIPFGPFILLATYITVLGPHYLL